MPDSAIEGHTLLVFGPVAVLSASLDFLGLQACIRRSTCPHTDSPPSPSGLEMVHLTFEARMQSPALEMGTAAAQGHAAERIGSTGRLKVERQILEAFCSPLRLGSTGLPRRGRRLQRQRRALIPITTAVSTPMISPKMRAHSVRSGRGDTELQ